MARFLENLAAPFESVAQEIGNSGPLGILTGLLKTPRYIGERDLVDQARAEGGQLFDQQLQEMIRQSGGQPGVYPALGAVMAQNPQAITSTLGTNARLAGQQRAQDASTARTQMGIEAQFAAGQGLLTEFQANPAAMEEYISSFPKEQQMWVRQTLRQAVAQNNPQLAERVARVKPAQPFAPRMPSGDIQLLDRLQQQPGLLQLFAPQEQGDAGAGDPGLWGDNE